MSQRSRRGRMDFDEEEAPPSYVRRPRRPTQSASQPSTRNRNGHDDGDMASMSQPSQGGKAAMPEDEKNHMVASVIRYLFIADRSKTIIQRIHIVKNVMPNSGKHFRYIMKHVKEVLSKTFGYNLVELEGNKYVLTNNIANDKLHLQFTKPEKAELVLLFIALSHIFMIDESGCSEEELFDVFRSLDIIRDDSFIHEYFGNVKTLITEASEMEVPGGKKIYFKFELDKPILSSPQTYSIYSINKFVKQGYLELVNVDNSDQPRQHYQWGQRAENELTPRHVLEFMSKIFGGRPLTTWPAQFKQMQMRENLNNEL